MYINQSNIKWNGSLKYNNNPNKIIIHNADHSNCTVYDIDRWHKDNGWAGIGYQYFIRKDGSIWTGRPENAVGAHTVGENSSSIGICLEGAFMKENPTQAQLTSLKELIADIRKRRGNLRVYGHKDFNSTDCPGRNFPLNEFKNDTFNPSVDSSNSTNNNDSEGLNSGDLCTTKNISNTLNLRAEGNTSSKVLTSIPSGAKFTYNYVDSRWLGWLNVTYNGVNGFVSADYVKKASSNSNKNNYAIVTASTLNVRSAASTNSKVIGEVYKDEKVLIKWTEPGWHYIQYDTSKGKKEGYVSAEYVKES